MRRAWWLAMVLFLVGIPAARAGELIWVTDEEITAELASRQNDLVRTTSRIEQLGERRDALRREIDIITADLASIDNRLTARISMLYRLSRNGRSLQYLVASSSAIEFLKRMATLRRLITSELEARREVSLALSRTMDEAVQVETEMTGAVRFCEELQLAIDELTLELAGRTSGTTTRHS